jgi:ABC-type uncharacterized transport system permease subunit
VSNEPFQPPSAPVRDRLPEPAGSSWKAVAFGVVADVAATLLASIVLFSLLGSVMVSRGSSPEDLDSQFASSDLMRLLMLTVGLSCTVLGGYVTAQVAKRREYYHALLTGIVVLVIGEIMISSAPDGTTLAMRVIGDILAIPAALLGAWLCRSGRDPAQP